MNKNKFFHSTSFYSTHPHYRWHVDLQDMVIFRRSLDIAKKDAYNFMLICVDDFSNYLMVDLIKDKCTTTILNSMIKIIQREGHIPVIVYCDQGSKFKNKLFDNLKTNGFQVQFTIDRRKAVYAEWAIQTICCGLEQYFMLRPNAKLDVAVQKVVNSHNIAPS